jgi:predicted nucleic acid-binding protein
MIVIADATPLHYLILIHQDDLLPQLFDSVFIPPAVFDELQHIKTPESVRHWMSHPPSWHRVEPLRSAPDASLNYLDPGEREAIALAEQIHADQLLLDEVEARREAARRNLSFIGTLGVLREGARRDLLDLRVTLAELQATTFYVDPALIRSLLEEDDRRRGTPS